VNVNGYAYQQGKQEYAGCQQPLVLMLESVVLIFHLLMFFQIDRLCFE
jgi:hypothetical protein